MFTENVRLIAILAVATYVASPAVAEDTWTYPQARVSTTTDTFQISVPDPYRWLEELESAETTAFVQDQNALATGFLDALPEVERFKEALSNTESGSWPGVPAWRNGFWLRRSYQEDGSQQWLIQKALDDAPIFTISSAELEVAELRWIDPSPDGRVLAYSVVVDGGDLEEIRFLDMATKHPLPDTLRGIKFNYPVWLRDSSGVVYPRLERPGNLESDGVDRHASLAVHRMGAPQSDDQILFSVREASSDGDLFSVDQDHASRFLVVTHYLVAKRAYSTYLIDQGRGARPHLADRVEPIFEAATAQRAFVGATDDLLYFQVQDEVAPKGRIIAVNAAKPTEVKTVVSEGDAVLSATTMTGDQLVVLGRKDVLADMRVYSLTGTLSHQVKMPAPGSAFSLSSAGPTGVVHFGFDAFTVPATVLSHDLTEQTTRRSDRRDLKFDSEQYVSRQLFVTSSGGARVPLFVSHRKGLKLPAPTMLHGYGAVGMVVEPQFRSEWGAWMAAGGVFAVANVRGGGAYGRSWSEAGILAQRQNTYDDFIAAASELVELGVTSTEQLVIDGASNGGMLVGAVLAQRPDLFAAATPRVPVMDVVRFASQTAGPRMIPFIGDPNNPAQLGNLLRWSPLHSLRDGVCYPATLIVAAMNDDLVHPSQSYKYAARLQAVQDCERPVLMLTSTEGGHMGPTNKDARTLGSARVLAFAAARTGLKTDQLMTGATAATNQVAAAGTHGE